MDMYGKYKLYGIPHRGSGKTHPRGLPDKFLKEVIRECVFNQVSSLICENVGWFTKELNQYIYAIGE
jgi:hypothetical protein